MNTRFSEVSRPVTPGARAEFRNQALALAVSTLAFGTALFLSPRISVWITTFVAGLLAIAISFRGAKLDVRKSYKFRIKDAAVGIVTGLAMVSATHLLYPIFSSHFPVLDRETATLYGTLNAFPGSYWAMPLMVIIIVAEEIVWRELAYTLFKSQFTSVMAAVFSLLCYALPQLGSSWLTIILALCCGTVWTAQRLLTGSLTACTITHCIWSASVLVIWPVTTS